MSMKHPTSTVTTKTNSATRNNADRLSLTPCRCFVLVHCPLLYNDRYRYRYHHHRAVDFALTSTLLTAQTVVMGGSHLIGSWLVTPGHSTAVVDHALCPKHVKYPSSDLFVLQRSSWRRASPMLR